MPEWAIVQKSLVCFFNIKALEAMYAVHKLTEGKNNCSVCFV